MNNVVVIEGSGFSASCCARLLSQADVLFAVEPGQPRHVPAILVGEGTRQLFADLFREPELFTSNHRIEKRIVAWGAEATPMELAHDARIVAEDSFPQQASGPITDEMTPAWTIQCARLSPSSATQHVFGSRIAYTATVSLKPLAEQSACWIESVEDGWLFLFTTGNHEAWLLAVGSSSDSLLGESRLISSRIDSVLTIGTQFSASPRITDPLATWRADGHGDVICCGSAALGFDPVCGDGSGNALRESILACAVVRAAMAGEPASEAMNHYTGRLLAGLLRHLQLCRNFYQTGGKGPWWAEQVAQLDIGIRWTFAKLAGLSASPFRLNDFSLERVAGR